MERVSIIIPVYNEVKYIERCLRSILMNDYPKDKLEILIFDGGSTDGTREVLKKYQESFPTIIKVFNNSKRHQVYALNEGIKIAKGNIIIRCDAHSEYPPDYIKTLVYFHKKALADNIGGVWETYPGAETLTAKAIAIALNSKLGVGISYRTLKNSNKPIYVDTVPFGSWKKEVFQKYGLFDEKFIRAEDFEHNIRIRKHGGKILLLPWLRIKYYARDSLRKLAKMSYQYGYAKVLVFKKHRVLGNLRQIFPALFVLTFPISFPIYFVIYSIISLFLAIKNRNIKLTPLVFLSFFIMHFFYGLGYIKGLIDIFTLKKEKFMWEMTR